jgi:polar amino acid transport system substrate-binding protein
MRWRWLAVVLVALFSNYRLGAQERPLVWAADLAGGEPYISENPEKPGEYLGFEVDLSKSLARELGRPIVFKQYIFEKLLEGLDRRDFDLAMNGLEITPRRLQQARVTRPYYVYRLQLVVRNGDNRFKSLDDVAAHPGAIVGTLSGSYAEEILRDQRKINYAPFDGQDQVYLDLLAKRVDAVYLDTIINEAYLSKPEFQGLKPVGEAGDKGYYGIVVRKDDEKLQEELNAALGRLIASGELRQILKKWGLWNADQYELGQPEAVAAVEPRSWTFANYLPMLARGAWTTVQISFLSMALAIVLGLIIAVSRMYGPAPLRMLATLYIEFFRGIPVLLLLLFLYFAVPKLFEAAGWAGASQYLTGFTVAILGLGINYAAYEAEIYRAGIGAVPPGQWEAAASLGMSSPLTFRRIILPQAIRYILPPMTNDFVALFKDTSIVSMIAVFELSHEYQVVSKNSVKYLEVGLVTAALYLIMSVPLGYLSRYLERRWGTA